MRSPVDVASFEAFHRATAQYVFNTARRAAGGDKSLADDVLQEAYVELFRLWPERHTREIADNRRYVIGIALHKLADAYRSTGVFGDGELYETRPGRHDVEALVNGRALQQAVRDLLAAQPPKRRLVGVLFFIEEWEYAEIAGELGLAQSTVRTHVERLRVLLRHLVDSLHNDERKGEPS